MRLAAVPVIVVAIGLVAGVASARPASISAFRTPSGNIGCVYSPAEPGYAASLRCDIRSGLRPKPARPKRCDLDYGDSFEVAKTGRAIVVRYGKVWRRDGFACASRSTGLRCSNARGHGFFMSRSHSYRF